MTLLRPIKESYPMIAGMSHTCPLKASKGVRPTGAVAQTRIPLSGSLKRFLFINLGEAEDQQCQLFEPRGRVLVLPGTSLRFTKKRFRTGEKGFGQQPVHI
jgi:hypothetical protein